jgi:hypothetical protein
VRWCWRRRRNLPFRLICEFAVTAAGVLLALTLTDSAQHNATDRATAERLALAAIEAQYVGEDALDVLKNSTPEKTDTVSLVSFDLFSARAVLEDANAIRVVPVSTLSLLRTYVLSAEKLQTSLALMRMYLASVGFVPAPFANDLRTAVQSNSVSLFADASVVQGELRPYLDVSNADRAAVDALQRKVREAEDKARVGGVVTSQEPATP